MEFDDDVSPAVRTRVIPALLLVMTAAAIAFAWLFLAYRRRLHVVLCRDLGFPITTVELHEFDRRFQPGPFGVSTDVEVSLLPDLGKVIGGVNPRELWVLAGFALGARRLFEFGTATGRTTYVWARNAAEDALVGTLTLPPDGIAGYRADAADSDEATAIAVAETRFRTFVFDGTDVEPKIRLYLCDSKEFDESEWVGACDCVFVDGSHAYSYVRSDSAKAMRMVRPGGAVLWHDYRGPAVCGDVYRYLNELAGTLPLVRLAGTRLVAWRRPAGA